jgi:hypothetical protein
MKISPLDQVRVQRNDGRLANGYNSLFVAFAQYPNQSALPVDIVHIQAHKLAHSQSTSVQDLEHQRIAHLEHTVRIPGGQESLNVLLHQNPRGSFPHFGRSHSFAGVAPNLLGCHRKMIERTEHCELPRDGRWLSLPKQTV